MPRLAAPALALFAASCTFDASVPATAKIRCSGDSDCPQDYSCSLQRQLCIPKDRGGDLAAPVLAAGLDRQVARAGAVVRIDVASDEALPVAPRLELFAPGFALELSPSESPDAQHFVFLWQVPPGLADGPVQVLGSAEDLVGNAVAGQILGRVEIDNTPPAVQAKSVAPGRVGPGALASVNVTFDEGVYGTATLAAWIAGSTRLELGKDPQGDRALAFQLALPLSEPSATWELILSGVTDEAGNPAPASTVGQLTVDADPPQVALGAGDAGSVFSAVPGFDRIELPLAISGATAAELCLGARCLAWDGGALLSFPVSPGDPEGPAAVTVSAVDEVGNRASAGHTVLLDFTPPQVLAADVQYLPPPGCPLSSVDALAPQGTVAISFSVNEPLAGPPTVEAAPLSFTADLVGQQSFRYQHALLTSVTQPPGKLDAGAVLVDRVGNSAARSLGELAVDVIPPAALSASQRANFVYRRAPWGEATADAGAQPAWSIRAPAQTFEPGTLLSLWSGPDRSQAVTLAVLAADDGGSLPQARLPPVDLPAIYFSRYDTACNPDGVTAQVVPRVEWIAALNGRQPGNDNSNPHSLQSLFEQSNPGSLGREWTGEGARADGTWARVFGVGAWRRFGTPPPSSCYSWDESAKQLYLASATPPEVWRWDGDRFWHLGTDPTAIDLKKCMMGQDGVLLGLTPLATVRWTGRNWEPIDGLPGGDPQGGPSSVSVEALLWDPQGGTPVALLNREGEFRSYRRVNQVWVQNLFAPTTPRYWPAAGFVRALGRLVVGFGSTSPFGPPDPFYDAQAYELSPNDWEPSGVWSAPPPSELAQGHLVSGGAQTYLFGGFGQTQIDPLYRLEGNAWVPLDPVGAAPFNTWRAVWADDGDALHALAAGGTLHRYGSAGWETVPYPKAEPTWRTKVASASSGALWTLGGAPDAGDLPPGLARGALFYATPRDGGADSTFAWNGATFGSPLAASYAAEDGGALAPARSQWAGFAAAPSTGQPLLFTAGPGTSVWRWSGAGWQRVRYDPTVSLPGMAVATHADMGHVVAVGGFVGGAGSNLVRLFDGSSWSVYTGARPGARGGAAMAWDPARRQVVLFGGEAISGGAAYNDTWVWNGSTWTNVTPAPPLLSPPPRAGASLAFDPVRRALLLFGGRGANDTWTWDGQQWAQLTAVSGIPDAPGLMAFDPVQGAMFIHSDTGPAVLEGTSTPGHVATFNLGAMNLPPTASLVTTTFRASALHPGMLALAVGNAQNTWAPLVNYPGSAAPTAVTRTLAGATPFIFWNSITGHLKYLLSAPGVPPGAAPLQTDFVQLEVTYSMP